MICYSLIRACPCPWNNGPRFLSEETPLIRERAFDGKTISPFNRTSRPTNTLDSTRNAPTSVGHGHETPTQKPPSGQLEECVSLPELSVALIHTLPPR